MRLLQFFVHTHQPLTVLEAVEIIATETEADLPCFDVDGRVFGDGEVLRHCSRSMSIVEVTGYRGKITKELHLAHFSVKEFLASRAEFGPRRASIVITMTCLTYLTDITGSPEEIKRNFPMAKFAAKIWTASASESHEDLFQAALAFLEDDNTFQRWGRYMSLIRNRRMTLVHQGALDSAMLA